MRPIELDVECLAERATRGPRYTSYPPATQLGPIAEATVLGELEVIRQDGPAALYIHVPFCRSLCAYCGCNVIPTRDMARGDGYVDTLRTEMAILASTVGPDFPISEISLGGGSPNFLAPRAIRALITSTRRCFDVSPDARLSVELDPRSTTVSQIETFAGLGFRALSVGVQDFSERVQDAIRRHQSKVQTRWLIDLARHHGFNDVNVDIVYGLPHQQVESFADTLAAVIDLAPDRIALFGYAHIPSRFPHQVLVERAGRVLDRYERATLLLQAIDTFSAAGYIYLGLDHFARPGSPLARAAAEHRMERTFQGYVEHRANTILGLGVSAISSTRRMFWQNHGELGPWEAAIAAQRMPVARGLVLERDDQIRRALIGTLMCEGKAELAALATEFAIDPQVYFARELATLGEHADLATYDAQTATITTTALGRLLVRNVCMVFDRYQDHLGEARGSSTI